MRVVRFIVILSHGPSPCERDCPHRPSAPISPAPFAATAVSFDGDRLSFSRDR